MTDAIPPSRRRRVARRAVIALVGVVLLAVAYAGNLPFTEAVVYSWFQTPSAVRRCEQVVNSPLRMYLDSDLPGSSLYYQYYAWSVDALLES